MRIIIGFLFVLLVDDKYDDIGFIIMAVGSSIGVYSMYFSTMKNRILRYTLSWVSMLISLTIALYLRNNIEFFKGSSVIFSVFTGPAVLAIIVFIIQIIFNVPKD